MQESFNSVFSKIRYRKMRHHFLKNFWYILICKERGEMVPIVRENACAVRHVFIYLAKRVHW